MDLVSLASTSVLATAALAQSEKNQQPLVPKQQAPSFSVPDVYGQPISLAHYQGQKVLLVFARFAGCPVCNLRFHQLEARSSEFKVKGLAVITIYESSATVMKDYIDGQSYYSRLVPNPDESLYKLYQVERSVGKTIKGIVKGAVGKALKGNSLYTRKVTMDGHKDRISAEFLIDEQGNIATAYYGQYLGDELPMESIEQFLN
ncbi:redoxin domain-containing protein [Spirosoma sp. SC4-14]|uniref:redoxin domain-containing protein n=1 Tax=Spirosoma sp. SC4-14 TaxID=3128900 RepID=UPI0030CC39C5